MSTYLDHIVIAAPDLNELVSRFTQLTGIEPIPGGTHKSGSANALVPLSYPAGSYLELIGPDPEAEKFTADNFALASTSVTEPRVAAWCIRPDSLDQLAEQYKELDIEPHHIGEMSRHTPAGTVLSWRLISTKQGADYSAIPFAIDWQDSAHPSTIVEPQAAVAAFTVHGGGSTLESLAEDFTTELRDVIELNEGAEFLELTLNSPKGLVSLADI